LCRSTTLFLSDMHAHTDDTFVQVSVVFVFLSCVIFVHFWCIFSSADDPNEFRSYIHTHRYTPDQLRCTFVQ